MKRPPTRYARVARTPFGLVTMREEIYCWRMALHGNQRRACREAYNRDCRNKGQRGPTPKLQYRIDALLVLHDRGAIDLKKGPWLHYKWARQIGGPCRYKPLPKGYAHVGT